MRCLEYLREESLCLTTHEREAHCPPSRNTWPIARPLTHQRGLNVDNTVVRAISGGDMDTPNGPSIGVSSKIVIFGAVGNATIVLKLPSAPRR